MQNTFIASEIRAEWAREKLDQLEMLIDRCVRDVVQAPTGGSRNEHRELLLDLVGKVTPEARRLVSEYALHARAALDYIVYDLALHNIGAEPKRTQFPICKSPQDFPRRFDGQGCRALEHLTSEQVALVERFQPYRGFPLLQVLHSLSNQDKHREFAHIQVTSTTAPICDPDTHSVAVGANMDVKFRRSFYIELGQHGDAAKTLRQIQAHLAQILSEFNSVLHSTR
jgi:hypothetical protein